MLTEPNLLQQNDCDGNKKLVGQKGIRAVIHLRQGEIIIQYEGYWRSEEDINASADPDSRDKLYTFYFDEKKTRSLTLDASPIDDDSEAETAPMPSFSKPANSSSVAAAASSSSSSSPSSDEDGKRRKNPPRLTQQIENAVDAMARSATGPAWQTPNRVAELLNDYRKRVDQLDHPDNVETTVNVGFVNVEVCGRPMVFIMVIRPVPANGWLRTDYGRGTFADAVVCFLIDFYVQITGRSSIAG